MSKNESHYKVKLFNTLEQEVILTNNSNYFSPNSLLENGIYFVSIMSENKVKKII